MRHCVHLLMCILNVVQELQVTLPSLSAPYAAATMSSLRHLCADARKAKGAVIHPLQMLTLFLGDMLKLWGNRRTTVSIKAHLKPNRAKKVQPKRSVTSLTKIWRIDCEQNAVPVRLQ